MDKAEKLRWLRQKVAERTAIAHKTAVETKTKAFRKNNESDKNFKKSLKAVKTEVSVPSDVPESGVSDLTRDESKISGHEKKKKVLEWWCRRWRNRDCV